MAITLLSFILYLVCILCIGIYTFRMNKSHSDFILGGRRLNPWVVALSERASGESAWLLLGLPGLAYAQGFIGIWDAIGCVGGIIFYWFVIAERLREYSEKLQSITLPDFFARNFHELQNPIRICATIMIIFFFTFYLAAQFNGAGKVLFVTFNIDHTMGILIGALVIVVYTMMGGFFAVAWTDMFQAVLMFGTLVILPLAAFIEVLDHYADLNEMIRYSENTFGSITANKTGLAGAAVIISGLSWGLGYMGQPHLLTRFMSINKASNIRISRKIAIVWAIPAFTGAILIGLVGLLYFGNGVFDDTENIMPELAKQVLPVWLSGIFISAAIAAMMSTADSQLLVITSSIIEDIYHKILGKSKVSEIKLLNLSRVVTIIVGLFGLGVALISDERIFDMVSYAWGGLGAAFGPSLLLILWWKNISAKGVLAGMIVGSLATIIWPYFEQLDEFFSARLVAWVLSLLVVVIVSSFDKIKKRNDFIRA